MPERKQQGKSHRTDAIDRKPGAIEKAAVAERIFFEEKDQDLPQIASEGDRKKEEYKK